MLTDAPVVGHVVPRRHRVVLVHRLAVTTVSSIVWSSRRLNRRRILAGPGWLLSVKRPTRFAQSAR